MQLTHLSLFSGGIDGLALAGELAGFTTVAHCEIDETNRALLRQHWPEGVIYDDVRGVTRERLAADGIGDVTLVSAGVPCQPASAAGKRQGDRDDRWLWGEFIRIVGDVRPRWIVGENPSGLGTLRLSSGEPALLWILRELTALGYSVGWGTWGAADVGAPHRRDRVFLIGKLAHTGNGPQSQRPWQARRESGQWTPERGQPRYSGAQLADAASARPGGRQPGARGPIWDEAWRAQPNGRSAPVADGFGHRLQGQQQAGPAAWSAIGGHRDAAMADPTSIRRKLWTEGGERLQLTVTGRDSAQDSTTPQSGLGHDSVRSAGRLANSRYPAPQGPHQWPWEPPRTIERHPGRAALLTALGNSVVVWQALPIFDAIAALERGAA